MAKNYQQKLWINGESGIELLVNPESQTQNSTLPKFWKDDKHLFSIEVIEIYK